MSAGPRSLALVAYQCGPGMGSVSQLGWQWFTHLAARHHRVTLVTHVRNRAAIEAAPDAPADARILYIDTEWLAGPLYRLSRRLFPHSEHSVFMLSQLDYFAFDLAALRVMKREVAHGCDWEFVHIVTPVTTLAPSRLHRLGLPLVRGPLNCGLPVPKGFGDVMQQDSMGLSRLRFLPALLERLIGSLRSCKAVLVATQATLQSVPSSARSRCVHMLENAVDPRLFKPGPLLMPPGPGRPLRISFVGRLVPVKALPLLLAAIGRLIQSGHRIELDVVGEGPMKAHWQACAAQWHIQNQVHWLGALPAPEVAQVMQGSHVFCLPSVRESGGAVVLEALACERPAIVMDFGGPAEIVDDTVGWKVQAQDTEDAVSGLMHVLLLALNSPHLCAVKGRAGRQRVLKHYTWDAKVRQAETLYDQMVPQA